MLVLFVAVFSGCKKDDTEPSTKQLMTKKWKVTSGTFNGAFEDYFNNSTFHFKTENRYSIFWFNDNENENGDWFMQPSDKQVKLISDVGNEVIFDIQRIEKSFLKLRYTYFENGIAYVIELNLE
jgi:hypothetical protein